MSTHEQNIINKREIKPNAVYITAEAAILCAVEESTIRAMVRTGKLRGSGSPYRFLGSELLRWMMS